jgi:hypothetical protein
MRLLRVRSEVDDALTGHHIAERAVTRRCVEDHHPNGKRF